MPDPPDIGKSFTVSLKREGKEILGMTIGGGAPAFPCIYVVQVFAGGLVATNGIIEPGDEISHVNDIALVGKDRREVATIIKKCEGNIRLAGTKLYFQVIDGITMDIMFNDFKHRMLDTVSDMTAEKMGLTRAILVNDDFIQRFALLEKNEAAFKQLSTRIHGVLEAFQEMCSANRQIAEVFDELASVDTDTVCRQRGMMIAEAHRQMNKTGLQCIEEATPLVGHMQTFLKKAMPDARETIEKYLQIKYIFLAFCLKVQLLDEEEADYTRSGQYLERLSSGNMEYRIALRCLSMCKTRFSSKRKDVIEKLHLLDNKRLQDLQQQLCKFVGAMYHHLRQSSSVVSGIRLAAVPRETPFLKPAVSDGGQASAESSPRRGLLAS